MSHAHISRRHVLQAGGAAGLVAALGLTGQPAAADGRPTARITDLGPAVVQFSLMSAVLIGDTVYIGSRNVDPVRVIALHLPTRTVVAGTDLTNGHSVQALAADPAGRYLYAGVLQKADVGKPNLFRWDLTTPGTPAEPIGRIGDRDVRALAVAPDGVLYAVGGGADTAPALWEWDPATRRVRDAGTPGPEGTLVRAVAATGTTVFLGAGTTFNGGGDTGRATLYAYDRSTGTFTSVAPREMEKDPSVRDLAVMGGTLVVGSAGSTEPSKVALMDLADLSSYTVATSTGTVAKLFTEIDDTVYFAGEDGIHAYDRRTDTIAPVEFDGPDLGEIWGVDGRDGKIVVTSAFGFVAEIDPAARTSAVIDLADAGAPGRRRPPWALPWATAMCTSAGRAPSPVTPCAPARSSTCARPARPRTWSSTAEPCTPASTTRRASGATTPATTCGCTRWPTSPRAEPAPGRRPGPEERPRARRCAVRHRGRRFAVDVPPQDGPFPVLRRSGRRDAVRARCREPGRRGLPRR